MSALAVIGSRGMNAEVVRQALDACRGDAALVVSGGARGADDEAEWYASQCGLSVVSYRPARAVGALLGRYVVFKWVDEKNTGAVTRDGFSLSWPTFAAAAKARNWWIVRDAARVLALWDGTSSGTAHGIAAAVRLKREVRIWMEGDS